MMITEHTQKKQKKDLVTENKIRSLVKKEVVKVPVSNNSWNEPWETRSKESTYFNSYIEEFD